LKNSEVKTGEMAVVAIYRLGSCCTYFYVLGVNIDDGTRRTEQKILFPNMETLLAFVVCLFSAKDFSRQNFMKNHARHR